MSEKERWREPVSELPSGEFLEAKLEEGWRPVAVEWERAGKAEPEAREADEPKAGRPKPIPYGLRISPDCRHLEVDPTEKEVIRLIVAMIAADYPLSKIAAELTIRGYVTRAGTEWTQVKVFRLLPRVIEFGPEILSESEWSEHKERILAAVG